MTQDIVRKLFNYNEFTGLLTWKIKSAKNIKVGDEAGTIGSHGYIQVTIKGKLYLVHRIIWLWYYGYLPENLIDHKNRNKIDNCIKNLRETTQICNLRNTGNISSNTSGIKGVCFDKRDEKWTTYIMVNKKHRSLGSYKDFDDAVCARLAGEQCLNWSGCDFNSPAYVYVKENILN